jgi:hypothetical protein
MADNLKPLVMFFKNFFLSRTGPSHKNPAVHSHSLSSPHGTEEEEHMRSSKRPLSNNNNRFSYGATTSSASLSSASTLRLHRVPEEVADIDDNEDEDAETDAVLNLEEQGYFIGELFSPVS